MLGIPSPPSVSPLDPSGFIVKWVRGARWRSEWCPSCALAEPAPAKVAAANARAAAPAVTAVFRIWVPWRSPLLWMIQLLWAGRIMRALSSGFDPDVTAGG